MKKPKIKTSYIARCRNYVQWLADPLDGGLYVPDRMLPDVAVGDYTAVEAMYLKETHGQEVSCCEPYFYDCLSKGKASREFHIKGWLSMTRAGEAQPEEFFGCLGLRSAEEFRGIFGRSLILPLLRLIHRSLEQTIADYDGILKSYGSSTASSGASFKLTTSKFTDTYREV